jgi:aspartate 1-decarboxylase
MKRTLLKAKLHRATVTATDLDYIGSIAIDTTLLEKADILPFEKVEVVNLNNGQRWDTYAIESEADAGEISVRGGGARLANVGDRIIVMTYVAIDDPVPRSWRPTVIMLDEKNRICSVNG